LLPAYNDVKHAISSSFDQLEDLRRRLIASRKKLRFALLGIAALNIFCYLYAPNYVPPAFAAMIIMIIVYVVRRKRAVAQFRAAYKSRIVAPLTQRMAECEYDPAARVGDEYVHRSQLFPFRISSIQGEDLFVGKLGLTHFQFSELKLIQEQASSDDGSTHKSIMFQGVLFVADFHKHFEGVTVLTGNWSSRNSRAGKVMTKVSKLLLERKSRTEDRVIKLENEAFNDAFEVRTSHDVEARYILSSNMMERLLDFKNRGQGRYAPIRISFVDSCMFVSIWNSKDQFEVNLNREINDKAAEEIYRELSFYFGLIEDFDLNTRIWSKA